MAPSTAQLEARLAETAATLARLEARIARLEATSAGPSIERAPPTSIERAPPPPVEPRAARPAAPDEPARFDVALVGRSVLFLGGAYLLRAATDLGLVGLPVGAAAGLLYAAAILALADRAAGRGATLSSAFLAATALLVAHPLVDEMVLRFHLIGATASAALIAAFYGLGALSAARRRAPSLAWIATVATLAVVVALAAQTGRLLPYLWVLTAMAAGNLWLAARVAEERLTWPVAVLGNLFLLPLVQLVLVERSPHEPAAVLVAGVAFFLALAAGPMAAAIRLDRPTTPFEMIAAALACAVGIVDGARFGFGLAGRLLLGGGLVALGAAGTIAALARLTARADRRGSALFWTTLWLVVALAGLHAAADGGPLVAGLLLVAGSLIAIARRATHPFAELHAVGALAAAASAAGLVSHAAYALGAAPAALSPPTVSAAVVLVALVASTALLVGEPPPGAGALARSPRIALLALTVACTAGVIAWAAIALVRAAPPAAATLRTAILSAGAIALALASRHARARSASVLVLPLLIAIAAKLAVEDLRVGSAATLFAGFAAYGVALIVAPRLRPR